MAKLKLVRGSLVRLKYDVSTRGGKKFRAGLRMTLTGVDGGLGLAVYVRGRRHYFTMNKKDASSTFEILSNPDEGVAE